MGLVVVLVIITIVLIISHSSSQLLIQQKPLADYANNASSQVAMLIDGPVNAQSEHNQVLITISNATTTIRVFRGYNDYVINSKSYPMTEAGYHVFLRSLEYAQFTKGTPSSALSQASGFCPTGDRYIFTFNANGQQKERYWITNCNGDPHTFNGNLSLTTQLFESQVPDFTNMTLNLNL